MWPDLIAKAKQGGLDVIQTYVFWNLHEPQPGKVFSIFFSILKELLKTDHYLVVHVMHF